jgi:putative ABC transport system permease protein
MKSALLLAWRYLAHHRARTILLIVAVASTALLPIAVNTLVTRYSAALLERARSTSLVLGAPGSRYDLVLNALYFTGRVPTRLSMAEFTTLAAADQARAIPIHVVHHAKGFPVVGTSVDYFEVRGLAFAAGTPFAELGEAVVGARVARELGLAPGGFLLSDQGSLYDLTMRYPLRMRVVGVLAHSGTPDDGAVFVDVKTAWIMDGLGHGHVDAKAATPNEVLGAKNDRIALSAAVVEYQRGHARERGLVPLPRRPRHVPADRGCWSSRTTRVRKPC